MLKKLVGINMILTSILIGLLLSWMIFCIGTPSEFGHISHTYATFSRHDDKPQIQQIKHTQQPIGKIINDNHNSYGTAFIVDDHTIISNYHVVKGNIDRIVFKPQANGTHIDNYPTIKISEKYTLKHRDIAILHTQQSLKKYAHYTLTTTPPKWFESTTSFGYPHITSDEKSGYYLHQTTYRFLFHRHGVFYVAGVIYQGSSGSPMLNHEGKVYGIASFNYDKPSKNGSDKRISGGSYFTPQDIKWLQQHFK